MRQNYKPLSIRRQERKSKNRLIISLALAGLLIYALFFWILPTIIGSLSSFKKGPDLGKQTSVADSKVIAPPVLNIPYEATNTPQIRIKGYASPNAEVEIYIDDSLKKTVKTSPDGSFISDPIDLVLGTNNITGKTVDSSGNKSLGSKSIALIYSRDKPKLVVDQPLDNLVVNTDKKVVVSGSTDDSGNNTVTVNGARVIINSNGSFSQTISLNDGGNLISIVATNQTGNSTQLTRKVTYQSPSPTPIPTPTPTSTK